MADAPAQLPYDVADAVRAVTPIADEIVFADTGSRDATRAIAANLGARVIDVPWTDDFSAARNAALAHARFRWILTVDTDEILTTPDARAIVDAGIVRAPDAVAFLIAQDNIYDSGETKPNPVARLFQNHPLIRYRNPVHECVSESVLEHFPHLVLTQLDIHLAHRGYTASRAPAKLARNLALLERWVAADPASRYGNFKLGATLADFGRTDEALVALDRVYAAFADPAVRRISPYLHVFMVIYHRAILAVRGQASADAFEQVADTWLRGR